MSLDAITGLWQIAPYRTRYRVFHDKAIYPDDDAIVEMTIWEVLEPVPGSAHRLKYSFFLRLPRAAGGKLR